MLRTRLWMGAILIALVMGMLVVDRWLGPWYPFLFLFVLLLALAACRELLLLLGRAGPPGWLAYPGVAAVVIANWPAHLGEAAWQLSPDAWHWVLGALTAIVAAAFLVEMATFHEPGTSVMRIALAVWIVAYLGLLPSFFAQLRWLPGDRGTAALALGIFVPKVCDIGAYFTGRFLGRHKMTPVLSPKKTWEGLAGGLIAAVLIAFVLNRLLLGEPDWLAIGLGFTAGIAGVGGDLAESLIKRDCRAKDASQSVPGFGGVLDVVDAVLFAAPVTYAWLVHLRTTT